VIDRNQQTRMATCTIHDDHVITKELQTRETL